MSNRSCAVTGASGYVGSRIARALEAGGWKVRALGRRPGDLPYTLEGGVAPGTFSDNGVEALVHCAYDFRVRGWDRVHAVNVEGTRRLFEAAKREGVRHIVYISSTAAFEGCKSFYGRGKLEGERIAASVGAFVVRPGLVCGKNAGGMLGTLIKALHTSPVVPLIGSGRTVICTVHEEDLCALVTRLVEGKLDGEPSLRGAPITAASEEGIEFQTMLEKIAVSEGRKVVWAPLPWRLVWLGVKTLEVLHVPSGLRSDSVVSFVNTDPHTSFERTRKTGVSFRSFKPTDVTSG